MTDYRKSLKLNFIMKSKQKYSDLDYHLVDYKNETTPVVLICKEHGEFTTTPKHHINKGKGCRGCASISHKNKEGVDFLGFITKAHSKHQGNYSYVYFYGKKSSRDIVEINCILHGTFMQSINQHLDGRGCKDCGKLRQGGIGSYNPKTLEDIPEMQNCRVTLYFVKLQHSEETFCKIGITKRSVNKRLRSNTEPYKYTEVLFECKMSLINALKIEQSVITKHQNYKPMNRFPGWTECFNSNIQKGILADLIKLQGAKL